MCYRNFWRQQLVSCRASLEATSSTHALSTVSLWVPRGTRSRSRVRMRPPHLQTGTLIGQESKKRWTVPTHAINPVRMNSSIFFNAKLLSLLCSLVMKGHRSRMRSMLLAHPIKLLTFQLIDCCTSCKWSGRSVQWRDWWGLMAAWRSSQEPGEVRQPTLAVLP